MTTKKCWTRDIEKKVGRRRIETLAYDVPIEHMLSDVYHTFTAFTLGSNQCQFHPSSCHIVGHRKKLDARVTRQLRTITTGLRSPRAH